MPIDELLLVLNYALRCFAIWLFASAAVHKMQDFPRFHATLAAYRLVPEGISKLLGFIVLGLEVALACIMIVLFILPAEFALLGLIAPVMLLVYAVAMAINLMRGRDSIDCGCGGVPMPLSISLVLRNVLLAVLMFCSFAFTNTVIITTLNDLWLALVIAGTAGALGFVYIIFNQLVANQAIHKRLWLENQ